MLLACVFVGAIAVPYGAWVGDNLIRIVALPTVLALLFFLILDKSNLFLLLILIRVPIDPMIEATRFGLLSVGAVLNALIILIAFWLFIERPRAVSRIVIPMWLPLVLIMLFETARAPDLVQGIRTFLGYLTSVAVFTVPFYLKQCQKDMHFCIRLILLSSLIPVLYGFVDFAQGGYTNVPGDRISSTLPHPNIFAFYLVLVISLAFYMVKSSVMKTSMAQRWLVAAYMGVLMVLLVLTKTRSAWAACLVVFVVYGLMFERKYLIYVAVASVLALLVPAVQDRLADLYTGRQYWTNGIPQNSYEWRKMIWEAGWVWMELTALPLGYGLDSFAYRSIEFYGAANGVQSGAHNVYVQWLFEAGVVGLLCAAWLYFRLLSLLRMGMKEDRLGTVIVITVVMEYLVVSYSDNMLSYLGFNWYYWFVLGTACSIIVARQAQTPVKAPERGSHRTAPGASHPSMAW